MKSNEITPEVLAHRLVRSPLKQAIYELRFPARVAVTANLAEFQSALGADFTEFEENQQLVVAPGRIESAAAFTNPTTGDKVSVSASVLNINSPRYVGYEDFRRRVESLCEAFDTVLRGGRDPVRVGLRYVNNIDAAVWGSSPLDDVLDSPLGHSYPELSSIREMAFQLTYLRGGLQMIERGGLLAVSGAALPMYIIDIDVALVDRVAWSARGEQWEPIHSAAKTAFLRHLKREALQTVFGGTSHAG